MGTPTATVQPLQQQSANMSFGMGQTPAGNMSQPSLFSTPTQAPPSAGFSFGTQQTNTVTPITSNTPSLGGFGLPAATQQSQPQQTTGFAFGQQQAQPASTVASLSFGLPAATTSTGLTLSINPLTTAAPITGLSFGQPSTQPSAPAFGALSTQVAPAFGGQVAQAPPAFGAPSTQAPVFGATQQQSLLSTLTSQPTLPIPTATPLISAAPQNVGLGGIDMSSNQPKAIEGKSESTKVKETQVPKEIIQTVDDFKAYLKQQKTLSSDIIRTTDRRLKSVTEEIKKLNCNVQEIANNVDNNKLAIKCLRSDTSKVIHQADMAQRTHETPSGLQFENTMPQFYFNELIHKYENDLLTLKHQVELTEKHLQSLSNPQSFTAQDMKRGLQQLHESFIALAGRLQETHVRVEGQKEQYLGLRKAVLRDNSNVFEVEQSKTSGVNTSKVQYGPNPFTSTTFNSGFNASSQVAAKQWSAPQQQPNTTSLFGNSSFNFK